MSAQTPNAELNYYSRYSRKKKNTSALNQSYISLNSRRTLNNSSYMSSASSRINNSDIEHPPFELRLMQQQKYNYCPLRIETGDDDLEPQQSGLTNKNQQQSANIEDKVNNFIQNLQQNMPSELSGSFQSRQSSFNLQLVGFHKSNSELQQRNHKTNEPHSQSNGRLFETDGLSISSIQQAESLYHRHTKNTNNIKDEEGNTIEIKQYRIINNNSFSSSKNREESQVTVRHNFKSMFKKKISSNSRSKEKYLSDPLFVNFPESIQSPKFGPFGDEQNTNNHQKIQNLQLVQDTKSLLARKQHQLKEVHLSNHDNYPYQNQQLPTSKIQHPKEKERLKHDTPPKSMSHSKIQKQEASQQFVSNNQIQQQQIQLEKIQRENTQLDLTLEDRLQKLYQQNFESPPNQTHQKHKYSTPNPSSKLSKSSSPSFIISASPKQVKFAESSPQYDGASSEDSLQKYKETSPKQTRVKYLEKISKKKPEQTSKQIDGKIFNIKQSLNLGQFATKQQSNHQSPYENILPMLKNLLSFVNKLEEPKKGSYKKIVQKLLGNVLLAKQQFQKKRDIFESNLMQKQTRSIMNNDQKLYKKYYKLISQTQNPICLEILYNKIIIQSITTSLAKTIGKHFVLESD